MPVARSVALVDRRQMPLAEWTSVLSARERAEADSYRHPARRARTVTSRVLSKYLVSHPEAPEFCRLRAAEIEAATSAGWGSLELLSGPAKARRAPALFQAGSDSPGWSVSSSHCGAYSAVCISRYRAGLDLERIESRR